jgi:hypothetical protein
MTAYGSLFNMLMTEQTAQAAPAVGDGATICAWSDRYAATIVGIKHFKSGARAGQIRSILVQCDKATRVDNRGMSDAQQYTYEADTTAGVQEFKVTKTGSYKNDCCNGLLIGERRHYYDYSF